MITVYIQWDLNLYQKWHEKVLENASCYTYVFVLHVFILRICAVFSFTSNLPKIRKSPIECQVKRTIRLLPSHLDKKMFLKKVSSRHHDYTSIWFLDRDFVTYEKQWIIRFNDGNSMTETRNGRIKR